MKRKLLSILALLCLTVTSAWALTPREGDTWDATTGTLTVNSDPGAYYSDYIANPIQNEILHVIITSNIGAYAFASCPNLKTVTIGGGVTSIGDMAFYGCTSLETITIYSPNCNLGSAAFGDGISHIYVFKDKKDYYKSAFTNMAWTHLENYVEAIPVVTANEGETSEYWATYYNDLANVKVAEGTQVFKVKLSGTSLVMTEIEDGIINQGEGVVLKSTSGSIELNSSSNASETSYDGNSLTGTMTAITNPGNAYVLSKTAKNGVGFYKLSATGTLAANKAYLTYSGGSGSRSFFLFDEATGIEQMEAEAGDGKVYDLQGHEVENPAQGIYIVNGKKVFIK